MEEEVIYVSSAQASNLAKNERHVEEAVSSTSEYPLLHGLNSVNVPIVRPQQKPKYAQLLAIIEELGKDIRPMYAGSRSSAERLKRGIIYARILVKECLIETDRNAK